MAGRCIEISDGVLIDNLYRILYNEFWEVRDGGFRDIFVKMGVATKIEKGEIGADEVDKIQKWLKGQHTQNEKIKLVKSLEEFRKISDDKNQFESHVEIVKEIYNLMIKNMIIYAELRRVLEFLTELSAREVIEKLDKFQKHAFKVKEFRRDNIVHQFRVFMLGCYILYEDKDFWVDRFRTDLTRILKGETLERLKLKLGEYAKYIVFKHILAVWMISSLFHDYGKVTEDAKKEFEDFKKTYNKVIDNLPEVELLSFNIPLSSGESIELSKAEDLFKKILRTFIDASISQIIEESMEELKHGTVSSELINYHFYHHLAIPNPIALFYYLLIILPSCIAIALHDNLKYFFCGSLTQLLVICDNIQEWNRITAIGDKVVRIFPCQRIYIKLENEDDGGRKTKIIQVFIPYEKPEDIKAQEIFRRFNPERIWRKNVKALKAAEGERAFNKLFQGSIDLTVRILFNDRGDSCTLKIKHDGTVKYQRTNIYANILENT